MAFSTSSLTMEAGRSTTSPAAIWLARSDGRRLILPTLEPAPRGGHKDEHARETVLERERLVGQANQLVAHVAEAKGHLRAEIGDVAADKGVEGLALAVDALEQHEHITPGIQHLGGDVGAALVEHALLERVDPRRQLVERGPQAGRRAVDEAMKHRD